MVRSILILSLMGWVALLLACSPLAVPTSTPDLQATTTRIAADIFATQTASVPTVTPSVTPSPVPSETMVPPTLTPSSTPNYDATGIALSANSAATVRACIHDTNLVSDEWRILVCDNFSTDENHWTTGHFESDLAEATASLSNGKYHWEVNSKQGVVYRGEPRARSVSDFYATVVAQVTGIAPGAYGIYFRSNGSDYYLFEIRDDQQAFRVWLRYKNEWQSLIGKTTTTVIRPEGVNRLTVKGESGQFLFYINDKEVGSLKHDLLKRGSTGVTVELSATQISVFDFDDFELRAP